MGSLSRSTWSIVRYRKFQHTQVMERRVNQQKTIHHRGCMTEFHASSMTSHSVSFPWRIETSPLFTSGNLYSYAIWIPRYQNMHRPAGWSWSARTTQNHEDARDGAENCVLSSKTCLSKSHDLCKFSKTGQKSMTCCTWGARNRSAERREKTKVGLPSTDAPIKRSTLINAWPQSLFRGPCPLDAGSKSC